MTLYRDVPAEKSQDADDETVVLNVQVRVTPSDELREGLPTEDGVIEMSGPEAVATAVAVAVADAPFEENLVPLTEAEVTLGAVTVTTTGPEKVS